MRSVTLRGLLCRNVALAAMAIGAGLTVQQANAQQVQTPPDAAQTQAPSDVQQTPAVAASPINEPADVIVVTGTGSLIRGEESVGVPVVALGQDEIVKAGATTVADALKSVPSVLVVSAAPNASGGTNTSHSQPVDIHGLNGSFTRRTSVLVDGLRVPPQNQDQGYSDPSYIPTLAIAGVDVLADGASATYGSDAVAGVVNVRLKRNFVGDQTQVRASSIDGEAGFGWQASQISGRKWDGGGATFTYEYYKDPGLKSTKRPFNTFDFTPYGLGNITPVNSAIPGIASTGKPNPASGTTCGNCFSAPQGTNGVGLNWTQFTPGTANEQNPYAFGSTFESPQTRNAAVLTFDQDIIPHVHFFGEAFWSARRSNTILSNVSLAASSFLTVPLPTNNPYYPVGAPTGLNVSFTLANSMPPRLDTLTEVARASGGFQVDLPFEWEGKLQAAYTYDLDKANLSNLVNVNNVSAALGNTINVAASPGVNTPYTYSLPANIPYLNPFCDSRVVANCIAQSTMSYMAAYRNDYSKWVTNEYSAIFDGPLFKLPGGTVKAAVGGSYVEDQLDYTRTTNQTGASNALVVTSPSPGQRTIWAEFAQLNVPIVGDGNAFPLVRSLVVEAAIRHDQYDLIGGTTNPKYAMDWVPIDGLKVHASYGTSFIAPSFAQQGTNTGVTTKGIFTLQNVAAGNASNGTPVCTTVGGTPPPGSAAAYLNPTCTAGLQFPGGISVGSSAAVVQSVGLAAPGAALGPEKSKNINFGADYVPTDGFLKGVNVGATYWHVKIEDVIGTGCGVLDNPACAPFIATAGNTPNFAAIVAAVLANPANLSPPTIPASNIQFLINNGQINEGSLTADGIDLHASYEHDFGSFGTWNAGLIGSIYLHRKTWDGLGTAPSDYQDPLEGFSTVAGLGNPTAHRFAARGNVGWTSGAFEVDAFINYLDDYYHTDAFPAAYRATHPDAEHVGAYQTYDLAVRFSPELMFKANYLRDLDINLVVNNIFDRDPPFEYNISSSAARGGITSYDPSYSPFGRIISLQFSKKW